MKDILIQSNRKKPQFYQKFRLEAFGMEYGRERYLKQLIEREHNGLIKVIRADAGIGKRQERAGKTGGQEGRNQGKQEDVPGRITGQRI